jgi:tetratricopeptide (TPR) repeat protein
MSRKSLVALCALIMALLGGIQAAVAASSSPTYRGSQTCASCHPREFTHWQDSHHALAMQHAGPDSVLGDFDDATFTYAGVETRFEREGDRFFVTTDGKDGSIERFDIEYTFGVEPLQQYLIPFDDGRLQALSIAWDSRPESEGGQRWFHLHPDEAITHEDDLHWTRPSQNWNHMCADCHSTDVRKGYDSATDQFNTTWSEISIGCEACHGPGSQHIQWAEGEGAPDAESMGLTIQFRQEGTSPFDSRDATGYLDQATSEPETCARCHAFRSQIAEGYYPGKNWLDYYRPEPLVAPFYHSDGQQREEVFTWASFRHSRMHAEGVTCSNCHEPHSQRLRAEGNALCSSCHTPSEYDGASHHHHPDGSPGAQCVNCHMPATTYMVVDPRRDHSIRIPRPDLSESLGTPNACNACHEDRSPSWAQQHIDSWYSEPASGYQTFAHAFAGARQGIPNVAQMLIDILAEQSQPEIVRASAAAHLAELDIAPDLQVLSTRLADPGPLVRQASLTLLEGSPPDRLQEQAIPLLSDPRRMVRIEAARLLAGIELPASARNAFDKALAEYEAELELHADRADSRNRLALLRWEQGRHEEALEHLRGALQLDERHTASYVNLADMLRALGRERNAEEWLARGLAALPESGTLHYAMGLTRSRQGEPDAALAHLEKAHRFEPDSARFAYAYALALAPHRPDAALEVLERALARAPNDEELLWAMATYSLQHRGPEQALPYARRLADLVPDSEQVQRLLDTILSARSP